MIFTPDTWQFPWFPCLTAISRQKRSPFMCFQWESRRKADKNCRRLRTSITGIWNFWIWRIFGTGLIMRSTPVDLISAPWAVCLLEHYCPGQWRGCCIWIVTRWWCNLLESCGIWIWKDMWLVQSWSRPFTRWWNRKSDWKNRILILTQVYCWLIWKDGEQMGQRSGCWTSMVRKMEVCSPAIRTPSTGR